MVLKLQLIGSFENKMKNKNSIPYLLIKPKKNDLTGLATLMLVVACPCIWEDEGLLPSEERNVIKARWFLILMYYEMPDEIYYIETIIFLKFNIKYYDQWSQSINAIIMNHMNMVFVIISTIHYIS